MELKKWKEIIFDMLRGNNWEHFKEKNRNQGRWKRKEMKQEE